MRWIRMTLLVLLAAGLTLPHAAADRIDPAWEKLKSLVGAWEGTYAGKPYQVSYALISNGTALMETMEGTDASQMVTVYHPDGSSYLMTHYCSMGNQSRMRSKGLQNGRIEFSFVDVTNVRSPEEHRMTRLVMSFPDPSHLVHEWTSKSGAKEESSRFEFARRK